MTIVPSSNPGEVKIICDINTMPKYNNANCPFQDEDLERRAELVFEMSRYKIAAECGT